MALTGGWGCFQDLGKRLFKRRRVLGQEKKKRHQIVGAIVDEGLITVHHLKKRRGANTTEEEAPPGPRPEEEEAEAENGRRRGDGRRGLTRLRRPGGAKTRDQTRGGSRVWSRTRNRVLDPLGPPAVATEVPEGTIGLGRPLIGSLNAASSHFLFGLNGSGGDPELQGPVLLKTQRPGPVLEETQIHRDLGPVLEETQIHRVQGRLTCSNTRTGPRPDPAGDPDWRTGWFPASPGLLAGPGPRIEGLDPLLERLDPDWTWTPFWRRWTRTGSGLETQLVSRLVLDSWLDLDPN
ncbi:unnamed protein product [Menidia menidia]|uniref:(Atlantic silverside) hypothetical protein n=1 Tax=Menidia menidia TaxID=238744 RepID=A0A8S4B225_9TELE|nr:unnamed protein product [Menidia menidia]